jgi:hypothetical protein
MVLIAAEQGHFPVFDQLEAVIWQLARGAVGASAHAENAIRKINRSVGFDCDIVRTAEAFPVVAVGEYRAGAVLLEADDGAVGHRGNDQSEVLAQGV